MTRDLTPPALRALADRVRDEMPWERGSGASALRDTVVMTLHALAARDEAALEAQDVQTDPSPG